MRSNFELGISLLALLLYTTSTTFTLAANKSVQGQSKAASSAPSRPITTDYDSHAAHRLQKAAKSMQHIWKRKRDIFLSLTTKGRKNSLINEGAIKQSIDNDYRHLVYELADKLSAIPVMQMHNATLRRQVQRLSKLQLYGLRKAEFDEAKDKLRIMQTFLTNKLVCDIHHGDECKMIGMLPTIVNHMMRAKRLDELNMYWSEWRKALNENEFAKTTFIDYIYLLRKAADYNGHVTPSRTWYLYYDSENFQRELEDVVWEIMPLYRELHAYLRHSVRQTYGVQTTDDDGAIPASVMEQIIHQAWLPNSVFREPYPNHHLPQVQMHLAQVLVTPMKVIEKATEFYESLGLNRMSSGFYEKYSRRISDQEDGHSSDCKSEVFYFPPDVALRYCSKVDYKKLMQMHGYIAELQYSIYQMPQPFGLDREPCPGFVKSLGEAAVVASGTPRHLHRLHILYNESLSEEQAINRQFRMGIHTILAIPQYFVNEKFLVDALDGRIHDSDYNCAYWRLQMKYAGVVAPMERSKRGFDPDYKFYRGLNPESPNTVKFLAEVLGHHLYRSFCLASDQYRPGDPEYPLHNCDFSGSAKAGELMKKMMQLGASKHWRDVMEIATGERKLSGRGVLEYFAPLYKWLKEKNKSLKLETGWDADIKCSNE